MKPRTALTSFVSGLALLAGLIAVLTATSPAHVVHAAADPADTPPGLIIGDSMTVQSRAEVRDLLPGWELDGESGRKVARIVPILREYKEAHGTVPPVVVIALGSNEQTYFRRVYQYAVDMVPAGTTVVFQSLWRDPAVWPSRSTRMGQITRAMHRVASRREHTCVSPWRARARADHEALIADGVHPTPQGRRVWARVLQRTVARCG